MIHQAEHVVLADDARTDRLIRELHRRGQRVHQRRAIRADRVERAGADQRLEHATIHADWVAAPAEVGEIARCAFLPALATSISTTDCPTPLMAPSP